MSEKDKRIALGRIELFGPEEASAEAAAMMLLIGRMPRPVNAGIKSEATALSEVAAAWLAEPDSEQHRAAFLEQYDKLWEARLNAICGVGKGAL